MTTFSSDGFAVTLRQISRDTVERQRLVQAHADDIGGSVNALPQGWAADLPIAIRRATWELELQLRYWNMADYEVWPELPGFDATSAQWAKAQLLAGEGI